MNLHWNKCTGDKWCPFFTVNLDHAHFKGKEGVYIIWHGGQSPWTVYVGQGQIADRLRAHRQNKAILPFSNLGLFVTWAQVDRNFQNGVERFLAERLQPKVTERVPAVPPIQANLPW